jgi:hypothetical protein
MRTGILYEKVKLALMQEKTDIFIVILFLHNILFLGCDTIWSSTKITNISEELTSRM